MVPTEVVAWLIENEYGEITRHHLASGGCINHGAYLETQSGLSFFLKTNSAVPNNFFAREAEGLMALNIRGGPKIPEVFLYGRNFLLLEDLQSAPSKDDFHLQLGKQLASLHKSTAPRFGFLHANYIGSTPQQNPWEEDGFNFYAQQRLLFQARLAHDKGLLGLRQMAQVESLALRLEKLVPSQPASLLHGDLWSGNIIADKAGSPALIDPAVYYGWAEADLAMTDLFGSLPEDFYQAYQSVRSLEPGFRGRYPIYNLYHLLNHLNLFGGGYLGSVRSILDRYS